MLYSVSSKQTNNNNNKREAIVDCHSCDTGCDCLALKIEKERRKKEGRKEEKERDPKARLLVSFLSFVQILL